MRPADRSTVGRHLWPLALQALLLLPMALGQTTPEELTHLPWFIQALDAVIFVVVLFLVARNLIRLWRAPRSEASGRNATNQGVAGLVFLLLAAGPLLEGSRWSTKPLGAAFAVVGALLITLGTRDAIRAARPRAPDDSSQTHASVVRH